VWKDSVHFLTKYSRSLETIGPLLGPSDFPISNSIRSGDPSGLRLSMVTTPCQVEGDPAGPPPQKNTFFSPLRQIPVKIQRVSCQCCALSRHLYVLEPVFVLPSITCRKAITYNALHTYLATFESEMESLVHHSRKGTPVHFSEGIVGSLRMGTHGPSVCRSRCKLRRDHVCFVFESSQ
jgi:hypothetical protein